MPLSNLLPKFYASIQMKDFFPLISWLKIRTDTEKIPLKTLSPLVSLTRQQAATIFLTLSIIFLIYRLSLNLFSESVFLLNLRTYFTNSGPSYLYFITSFPSVVNANRSLTCSFHPAPSIKGLQESISKFNPLRCGFKPYIYWCNESINPSMSLDFAMVVFLIAHVISHLLMLLPFSFSSTCHQISSL